MHFSKIDYEGWKLENWCIQKRLKFLSKLLLHWFLVGMDLITMERAKFKYFPQKKIARRIKMDLSTLIREARRREIGLTPEKFID